MHRQDEAKTIGPRGQSTFQHRSSSRRSTDCLCMCHSLGWSYKESQLPEQRISRKKKKKMTETLCLVTNTTSVCASSLALIQVFTFTCWNLGFFRVPRLSSITARRLYNVYLPICMLVFAALWLCTSRAAGPMSLMWIHRKRCVCHHAPSRTMPTRLLGHDKRLWPT